MTGVYFICLLEVYLSESRVPQTRFLDLDSSLTPASVKSAMQSHALKNVLSGIRKFRNDSTFSTLNSFFTPTAAGTTNALLNNGS